MNRYLSRSPLLHGITAEMVDNIPGLPNDRRTPHGDLHGSLLPSRIRLRGIFYHLARFVVRCAVCCSCLLTVSLSVDFLFSLVCAACRVVPEAVPTRSARCLHDAKLFARRACDEVAALHARRSSGTAAQDHHPMWYDALRSFSILCICCFAFSSGVNLLFVVLGSRSLIEYVVHVVVFRRLPMCWFAMRVVGTCGIGG